MKRPHSTDSYIGQDTAASLGWEAALWIWAYALVWFLVNDAVKMWTYRLLRQHQTP